MIQENTKSSAFPSRHVVLGMAGHIDHGKTAIVRALTGTDTDRLKEEKERGMTTDLGFAFLGDGITIIDVPGHEKFVKTMVAGVNTVDLALLVVAADDGVMPQTAEHLEILNLLRIPAGLVAVNKTDLVDGSWLEVVIEDVRKLVRGTVLEGAHILPVSALTGEGIDNLRSAIFTTAEQVQAKKDKGIFRMPIDRVFSIKGFGTVVAGTVLSGRVAPNDELELLPQGIRLRIRGLQVHDKPVSESRTGFRTAVNVMGIEKEGVERGNVLIEPGFFRLTRMADAHFSLLSSSIRPLKNRERVHVHVGTDEALARIILLGHESLVPGTEDFIQLHFEKPVVLDAGDRFIVRSYSPVRTIGGGSVLDVHPEKHRHLQQGILPKLDNLLKGDPAQKVLDRLETVRFHPIAIDELARGMGMAQEEIQNRLADLEASGRVIRVGKERWASFENRETLKRILAATVERFHREHPERTGILRAELLSRVKPSSDKQFFEETVKRLVEEKILSSEGDRMRLSTHRVVLTPELSAVKEKINAALLASPFNPPDEKEILHRFGEQGGTVLQVMIEAKEIVRLEEGILFHTRSIEQAKQTIRSYLTETREATVSDLRQHLGTTRKYAVPLVEHLDRIGFTERDGDKRRLKA